MVGARRWLPLSLLLLGVTACAGSYDYQQLKKAYVDQIHQVIPCGHWQQGGEQGSYRIVEARIYTQSVLFVQWLSAPAPDTGMVTIRASYAPAELNDDHADIALERLACHAIDEGIVVSAQAWSGHHDEPGVLRIEAMPQPGKASIGLQFGEAAPHPYTTPSHRPEDGSTGGTR